MIKKITILLLFLIFIPASAQKNNEQAPIFFSCNQLNGKELESCFFQQVQNYIYKSFKISDKLKSSNYNGTIIVLFEVDIK
jgi:hypothetical protein